MNLTTAADLAEQFGIPESKFHELRRAKQWPCVRFGRFDIRFTDEQVEQIVAMQSVKPDTRNPRPALPGQTQRSARRSA